jgi:hypothetical protein
VNTAVVGGSGRRATSPGGTQPSMYMGTTWTAAGSHPESSTWTSKAPYVDDGGRRARQSWRREGSTAP